MDNDSKRDTLIDEPCKPRKRTYAEVKVAVDIFMQKKKRREQVKNERAEKIGEATRGVIQSDTDSKIGESTSGGITLSCFSISSSSISGSGIAGSGIAGSGRAGSGRAGSCRPCSGRTMSRYEETDKLCGLSAFDLALNPVIEKRMRVQEFGPDEWADIDRNESLTSFRKKTNRYNNRSKSINPDFSKRKQTRPTILDGSKTSQRKSSQLQDDEYSSGLNISRLNQFPQSQKSSLIKEKEASDSPLSLPKKFAFIKSVSLHKSLMIDNSLDELPWLEDRLDMSSRSCRFGLPIDVFDLAPMTPIDYLRKHCHIGAQRRKHYKNIFERGLKKDQQKRTLTRLTFEKCILEVLHNLIDEKELKIFFEFNKFNDSLILDLTLFSLLCALSERILYSGFAKIPQLKKKPDPRDFLEKVDFGGLVAKIEPVRFDFKNTKRLLFSLS